MPERMNQPPGFWRRLWRDQRGSTGLLWGLSLPVLVAAGGVSFDVVRANALHEDLWQSVDAISQEINLDINQCLETQRTRQDGTMADDLDTFCLNDATFRQEIIDKAQTMLDRNFRQRGAGIAPQIVGEPFLDPATGRYTVQARTTYNCVFMAVIDNGCVVEIGARAELSAAFAQGSVLQIVGPSAIELWAERASPALPVQFTATGGWAPYAFSQGPGLPAGLSLSSSGLLTGIAANQTCLEPSCAPRPLGSVAIGVRDEGDQNFGGSNRQTAAMQVSFTLVHPLTIRFSNAPGGVIQWTRTGSQVRTSVIRTGGKPGYTFFCYGLPPGFSCNAATGEILGTDPGATSVGLATKQTFTGNLYPYNYSSPLISLPAASTSGSGSISGTISVSVMDGRNVIATTMANYQFGGCHRPAWSYDPEWTSGVKGNANVFLNMPDTWQPYTTIVAHTQIGGTSFGDSFTPDYNGSITIATICGCTEMFRNMNEIPQPRQYDIGTWGPLLDRFIIPNTMGNEPFYTASGMSYRVDISYPTQYEVPKPIDHIVVGRERGPDMPDGGATYTNIQLSVPSGYHMCWTPGPERPPEIGNEASSNPGGGEGGSGAGSDGGGGNNE